MANLLGHRLVSGGHEQLESVRRLRRPQNYIGEYRGGLFGSRRRVAHRARFALSFRQRTGLALLPAADLHHDGFLRIHTIDVQLGGDGAIGPVTVRVEVPGPGTTFVGNRWTPHWPPGPTPHGGTRVLLELLDDGSQRRQLVVPLPITVSLGIDPFPCMHQELREPGELCLVLDEYVLKALAG
jgi:hypothetical protein